MVFEEINESEFISKFDEFGRSDNFTYVGKRALFEYLENIEEDTNQKIKLDIIALCCDYTEYKDLDEYLNDYSEQHSKKDEFETEEEFKQVVFEEIENKTTLIKIKNSKGFIIQTY